MYDLFTGKSANIVFADAEIDEAVKWSSDAVFFNRGQSCDAGTRRFVQEDIYDDFVSKYIKVVSEIVVGNQMDSTTDMGPVVDEIQFNRIMGYIAKGISEGATCAFGGNRIGTEGYNFLFTIRFFISPTVFTNVTNDMTIAREEIFGNFVIN
jgi:aldehyde dehydrogenase (NAD+)